MNGFGALLRFVDKQRHKGMEKRKLKVTAQASHFNVKNRVVNVPSIKVSGKYLINLGFNIGDEVEISPAGNGELNIRRAQR